MVQSTDASTDSAVMRNLRHRKIALVSPVIVTILIITAIATQQDNTPSDQKQPPKMVRAAHVPSTPAVATEDHARDTTREILWMEKGKKAVKEKLKDPDSAKFKNLFFSRGADNVPCTCGEVNAKNSFGGFTGFQRFISGGSSDLTFFEAEVADFDAAWDRLCTTPRTKVSR